MKSAKRGTRNQQQFEGPVYGFQKIINGKYKIRILWDLQHGPRRYGEIRHGLLTGNSGSPEVAPRVLSREFEGGVERPRPDRPPGLPDGAAEGRVQPHRGGPEPDPRCFGNA